MRRRAGGEQEESRRGAGALGSIKGAARYYFGVIASKGPCSKNRNDGKDPYRVIQLITDAYLFEPRTFRPVGPAPQPLNYPLPQPEEMARLPPALVSRSTILPGQLEEMGSLRLQCPTPQYLSAWPSSHPEEMGSLRLQCPQYLSAWPC